MSCLQFYGVKYPKNFTSKKEAQEFIQKNIGSSFKVADLTKKPAKKSPAAPFTTSTLQQEAARKLYFSVSKTMNMAQRLYEAGHITYMRTDSVNLSKQAQDGATEEIITAYGKEYSKTRQYKGKSKGAQEAHEAIRPTNFANHTVNAEYDQQRLYELIWKRAIASQMSDAQPSRYTEASLVKRLEELGIGRPSTYAPTITTIQNRKYIEKGTNEGDLRGYAQIVLKGGEVKETQLEEKVGSNKGKLVPTDVGMVVNDFLVEHFSSILDYNFTAKVEEDFDEIAAGNEEWTHMMKSFYKDFHPVVEDVAQNAEREVGERVLGKDPESGKPVSVRLGKFGPMVQIGTVEDEEKPRFASLSPGADAPIYEHDGLPVQKGVGRFGPYLKWNSMFINVNKKYDFDNLTDEEIVTLIEEKKQKEIDKVIHHWEEEGIRVEKARWGRSNVIKGKIKIELPKTVDATKLTLKKVQDIIEKQGPKKKAPAKRKTAAKKKTTTAKKKTAKK